MEAGRMNERAEARPQEHGVIKKTSLGSRIESVDLVRGIIMVIMALDHTHDYFGSLGAQPTNIATTTTALFLTRWITHFCAPVFFLLTGVGASLMLRHRTKAEVARFLVTRGLWLLVLEVVVMRFALQFNVDYQVTILTVLWALGWAMIVLAAFVWFPVPVSLAAGVVLIVGHNALDGIDASAFGGQAWVWNFLHQPGIVINTGHSVVLAAYVLIPWVGVTALGYALGSSYRWEAGARRSLLLWLGVGALAAFAALRFINVYGDPLPWSQGRTPVFTVLSFVNALKYPPSLVFLLMTLGPALLLLRAFDGGVPRFLRPVHTIGRVPLFFYVLHFYLIHALALVACWWTYGTVANMTQSPDLAHFPFTAPPGWDFGLPAVYFIWVAVVLCMYPLCRWFAGVRSRQKWWWLSYL
jgi:uncharacterized membrane protein